MATDFLVILDRAWFVSATDRTDTIEFGTSGSVGGGGQRVDEVAQEGEFRNYANFVTRLVLGSSKLQIETLALRALTTDQVTWVKDHMGTTVLFRDTYGRRIWCSYIDVQNTDIPLSGLPNDALLTDIAVTLQSVSYDESV